MEAPYKRKYLKHQEHCRIDSTSLTDIFFVIRATVMLCPVSRRSGVGLVTDVTKQIFVFVQIQICGCMLYPNQVLMLIRDDVI